jgi:hypothetical protein
MITTEILNDIINLQSLSNFHKIKYLYSCNRDIIYINNILSLINIKKI